MADFPHMGMISQGIHDQLMEEGGLFPCTGNDLFFIQHFQNGQSGGTAQRVAGISVAVHEGFPLPVVRIKGIVDFLRSDGDGHGHVTARQPLGDAHDVRSDSRLVAREHTARTAKSRGDFIRNEMDVVGITQGAEFGKIGRRVHSHAGRSLEQGFHQQGGAFLTVAGEYFPRRINAFRLAAFPFFSFGTAVAVRGGNAHDVQQKRLVEFRVQVQAADRQGAQSFPVVAVAQRHEAHFPAVARLIMVLEAHLHGGFDGSRAVVGKIEFAESHRNFFH